MTATMEQGLNETVKVFANNNEEIINSGDTLSEDTNMEADPELNESNDDLTTSPSIMNDTSDTSSSIERDCSTSKAKPSAKVFKSFAQRLEELKAFKEQHSHCRVPSKFDSNPSLAAWCANLKQSYRLMQQGRKPILKLTEDKLNALEELGFEWKYSGRTPKASSKLKFATAVTQDDDKSNSKSDISRGSEISSEKNSDLSSEDLSEDTSKVKTSDTIGAEKCLKRKKCDGEIEDQQIPNLRKRRTPQRERSKSKTFHERLEELKEYKERFGHCHVSRNDKDHYSLGSWCHNLRGSFRANQKLNSGDVPILSQDKISALNEIGFDWTLKEPRQMKSFEERLQDLKEFKALFGHTRVPSGYEKNPSLAYWCNNLRNAYKMKKTGKKQYISLSQERIEALIEIGFEFGKKFGNIGKNEDNSNVTKISPFQANNQDETIKESDKSVVKEILEGEKEGGFIGLEGGVGPILFV